MPGPLNRNGSKFGDFLKLLDSKNIQTKPGKQAVCSWSSSIVNMMSVLCFFGITEYDVLEILAYTPEN